MAKIALLVPDESMLRQAHDVLQEMRESLHIMRVIRTSEAVSEARRAANEGAEVIISRGIQATLIRQYTDLPVVEIVMTAESAEQLLRRARKLSGLERPSVAFVMLRNMACPMTGLGERLGVELREYYVQNMEMLKGSAIQAIEDRSDVLIGGAAVLEIADQAGVPSLFLSSDETSVANAIREALKLGETLDREGSGASSVFGSPSVKERGKNKGKGKDAEAFVNFAYRSERMRSCVELAALLSTSACPKLLQEGTGSLYKAFAAAIHNHSPQSGEKLVSYDCEEGAAAFEDLFGRRGVFVESGKSTVQLNDIEHLEKRAQRRLLDLLLFRHVIAVTHHPAPEQVLLPELWYRLSPFLIRIPSLSETPEDVGILADTFWKNLCERYGKYHVLEKGARQYIAGADWPGNRIQLEGFLERLILSADRRVVREEAVRVLYGALYGGGGAQNIGPACGIAAQGSGEHALSDRESAERSRILEILTKHLGSREKTAKELGISTTTLWRKLKRLRIQ